MGLPYLLVLWPSEQAFRLDVPDFNLVFGTPDSCRLLNLKYVRVVRRPSGVVAAYFVFRQRAVFSEYPESDLSVLFPFARASQRIRDAFPSTYAFGAGVAVLRSPFNGDALHEVDASDLPEQA